MLDSRDKRASAIGCGLLWRVMLPDADGTIGAGDRQQVAALYRSILAAAAEPPGSEAVTQTPHGRLIEVARPVGRLI